MRGDESIDEEREGPRPTKGGKKQRTKGNKSRRATSGDAPTPEEVDADDAFINNDISDEETMPMEPGECVKLKLIQKSKLSMS